MHENRVEFQVSGDYAMFADPVTRVGGEKLSYQIPTYEALKGILQSVYWKPTLVWFIDTVRIMNPIQTETKGVRPIGYGGGNDLSYYTDLKHVRYQVRAHFEWNMNRSELAADRNENKHHNIAKRMIARGGRRDIFLGTRECQGYVEPCDFEAGQDEGFYSSIAELAYGFMYHGITYADEAVLEEDKGRMTVRFWRPVMKNGVIHFPRPEECTDKRHIKDMEMKLFDNRNFLGLEEFSEEEVSEWTG